MAIPALKQPLASTAQSSNRKGHAWRIAGAVEVVLAAAAILLDLLIPTLVLLAMAVISLIIRREGPRTLGLVRPARPVLLTAKVFGLCLIWILLVLALFMPVLEHLTGEQRDVSQFAPLEGNLRLLVFMLLLSWTLAAVGEEFAFRGYVQTRIREVLPGSLGVIVAVLLSSLLFGLIHTEQGVIGIALTTIDAIFFSVLRYRFHTLWASILAHGFNNTIGMVAFYIAGPFSGLW
jgi:membrane protease YdiL (CAAX protease family)